MIMFLSTEIGDSTGVNFFYRIGATRGDYFSRLYLFLCKSSVLYYKCLLD